MFRGWSGTRRAGVLMGLLLMVMGLAGCTVIIQPLYYQVTGTVTIGLSQLPLAGVEVKMSGPVVRTAITDHQGRYTITNLPRGEYTVTVDPPYEYTSPLSVNGNTVKHIVIAQQYYQVTGTVTIGMNHLPLAGVEVKMSGPVTRTIYTDNDGYYAITNLSHGEYTVTVETPFADDLSSLSVNNNTVYNVNASFPPEFNLEEFYVMSALWDLYATSGGSLKKGTGQGTWLWPTGVHVPMYLDGNGHATDAEVYNAREQLWDWALWTGGRVTSSAYLGYRPASETRFIQVQWVGSGQIPILENEAGSGTVGLAKVMMFDALGYLQKVLVLIDDDYGDVNSSIVLAHEFCHVVGAGHSEDPNSLMYPYVSGPSQRNYISTQEKEYMRVMYYLPPGLKLNYPTGTLAAVSTLSSGPAIRTTYVTADGKTKVVAGIPAELAALPVVQELFGSDVSSASVGGSMLWDSITF